MSASRVVAAWVVMLLLGSLLWFAGGHRLLSEATPTPTPTPSPAPSASATGAPSPSPYTGSADPAEFAGRWAELAGTEDALVVEVDGASLRLAGEGIFQPSGPGFEQVVGDTIRRLELDDDGNLQLITTQLGNEGQRRTVRAFTPEPEGDVPADPKQPAP